MLAGIVICDLPRIVTTLGFGDTAAAQVATAAYTEGRLLDLAVAFTAVGLSATTQGILLSLWVR